MKHPELNPKQRRSVNRLIRFVRKQTDKSVTRIKEVRFNDCDSFVSVSLRTRRNDCDEYSPREAFTTVEVAAHVARNGQMSITHARNGTRDIAEHVAYMTDSALFSVTRKGCKVPAHVVRKRVAKRLASK